MAASGKAPAEFRADMDQWYSLASIPVTAIFFGGGAFMLIRRWSPAGDRQDFNQTFTFINAYSVIGIPIGLVSLIVPSTRPWLLPTTFFVMALTFARVGGGGRWFNTVGRAIGRGALLLIVTLLTLIPASILLLGISAGGARFLP